MAAQGRRCFGHYLYSAIIAIITYIGGYIIGSIFGNHGFIARLATLLRFPYISKSPRNMAEPMDGSQEDNEKINPLMQPPILAVLFRKLPLEDLAKCRLVNKLFFHESLSLWRSKTSLNLQLENGLIVSTRDDGTTRTTPIRELFHLYEALCWDTFPIKSLSLNNWDFRAAEYGDKERFIKLFRSHITSLTLENCVFERHYNFRRIIYRAFPYLQYLTIDECKVTKPFTIRQDPPRGNLKYRKPPFGLHELKSIEISGRRPLPMMDLLSHFHQLESLHMRPVHHQEYRKLLKVIKLIRDQDQTKLPLKEFDVDCMLGGSIASSIDLVQTHEQLNIPLQHFKIWFSENMVPNFINEEVIRDTLQCHSSTLKHLDFGGYDAHWLCRAFPFGVHLNNLKKLVIQVPRFSKNFNYLRYTPNLRVLEINDRIPNMIAQQFVDFQIGDSESDELFSNSDQLEIGDWTLPTLAELTFHLPLSICNLGKLMRWMPNVERLKGLELDDVKFTMVCENWRNLKYLEDWGEELTDEGVIGTGINVRNISKLKNLASLKTSSSKLTPASVHDGFLRLANLKELSLGVSTQVQRRALILHLSQVSKE